MVLVTVVTHYDPPTYWNWRWMFGSMETFKIDRESLEKSLKTSCFHLLPQKRMIGKEMN